MNFWQKLRGWLLQATPSHGCRFGTPDDWGHQNYWYCLTHERWYPEQVFMHPPKCCREFEKGREA